MLIRVMYWPCTMQQYFGPSEVRMPAGGIAMVEYVVATIGPSEVRALPVRRCRRAAWQT
jgi:hypothetical protein